MMSGDFCSKYKIVKVNQFNMVPGGVHNFSYTEHYNNIYNNGIDSGVNVFLSKWTTVFLVTARGYPCKD